MDRRSMLKAAVGAVGAVAVPCAGNVEASGTREPNDAFLLAAIQELVISKGNESGRHYAFSHRTPVSLPYNMVYACLGEDRLPECKYGMLALVNKAYDAKCIGKCMSGCHKGWRRKLREWNPDEVTGDKLTFACFHPQHLHPFAEGFTYQNGRRCCRLIYWFDFQTQPLEGTECHLRFGMQYDRRFNEIVSAFGFNGNDLKQRMDDTGEDLLLVAGRGVSNECGGERVNSDLVNWCHDVPVAAYERLASRAAMRAATS